MEVWSLLCRVPTGFYRISAAAFVISFFKFAGERFGPTLKQLERWRRWPGCVAGGTTSILPPTTSLQPCTTCAVKPRIGRSVSIQRR